MPNMYWSSSASIHCSKSVCLECTTCCVLTSDYVKLVIFKKQLKTRVFNMLWRHRQRPWIRGPHIIFCRFSCVYCLFAYLFILFVWLPEMANKDEYISVSQNCSNCFSDCIFFVKSHKLLKMLHVIIFWTYKFIHITATYKRNSCSQCCNVLMLYLKYKKAADGQY